MYKAHFGLKLNPFSPTPAPEFIFESRELREALAHFRYALENREAFLLLTGEVGTGKTTAVQTLMRLLPAGTPVAVVTHTTLNPRELLEEIALKFGLADAARLSKPQLIRALEAFFEDQWRQSRQAILILDEAHLLDREVLEEVRLLSNLEREGGKLVQICLVGQPELTGHLHQSDLRQLRQRISVRYALRPLSRDETGEYVAHRLRAAGSRAPQDVFTPDAIDLLHRMTHGIPREINVIAGQAMLNAYLGDASRVGPDHVRSVRADFGFEGIHPQAGTATPASSSPPPPPPPPVMAAGPAGEPPSIEEFIEPASPAAASRPAPRPIPLPPSHLRPEPPNPRSSAGPPEPKPLPAAPPVASGPVRAEEPPEPPPVPREHPRSGAGRTPLSVSSGPGHAGGEGGSTNRGRVVILALLLVLLAVVVYLNRARIPGLGGASPAEDVASTPPAAERPPLTRAAPADTGAEIVPEPATAQETEDPLALGAAVDTAAIHEDERLAAGEGTGTAIESAPAVEEASADSVPSASGDAETRILVDPAIEGGVSPMTVQIGSFRSQEYAEQVRAEAERRTGLRGAVLEAQVGDVRWFRVLLGTFRSAEDASASVTPLVRRRMIREIVLKPVPETLRGQLSGSAQP